jgi:hypothetical protein
VAQDFNMAFLSVPVLIISEFRLSHKEPQ